MNCWQEEDSCEMSSIIFSNIKKGGKNMFSAVGISGLDKDLDQWVFHPLLFNLMSILLPT